MAATDARRRPARATTARGVGHATRWLRAGWRASAADADADALFTRRYGSGRRQRVRPIANEAAREAPCPTSSERKFNEGVARSPSACTSPSLALRLFLRPCVLFSGPSLCLRAVPSGEVFRGHVRKGPLRLGYADRVQCRRRRCAARGQVRWGEGGLEQLARTTAGGREFGRGDQTDGRSCPGQSCPHRCAAARCRCEPGTRFPLRAPPTSLSCLPRRQGFPSLTGAPRSLSRFRNLSRL